MEKKTRLPTTFTPVEEDTWKSLRNRNVPTQFPLNVNDETRETTKDLIRLEEHYDHTSDEDEDVKDRTQNISDMSHTDTSYQTLESKISDVRRSFRNLIQRCSDWLSCGSRRFFDWFIQGSQMSDWIVTRAKSVWNAVYSNPMAKIAVLGFLILIVVNLMFFVISEPEVDHGRILSQGFSSIKKAFPHQSDATFNHISISLDHIFEADMPREPPSMIVLIPPDQTSYRFPHCFIETFGKLANWIQSCDHGFPIPLKKIDMSYYRSLQPPQIQKDLNKYFKEGGKVLLVCDIDQLRQTDYSNIFHLYSDNTHAPFKRSIFFYFVPIPSDIYQRITADDKPYDIAKKILGHAWHESRLAEKIYSLLVRISSWGVILLESGDSCTSSELKEYIDEKILGKCKS